ncbi:uncharacterized protein PG986_004620 [Apiospora aurea]|uniref:Uncharacterized protein n=1 Tax=Apiospora aurea TaxID=335848 RepID=A0ABR1QN41_9PEZI
MFNTRKLQDVYKPGDTVHEVLANPDYEFPEYHSPRAVQLVYCMIRDPYDASIPDQLSEELLYNLLKFTRCLNVTRITRPWAKKWAVAIELSVANASTVTSMRLFIAWELGDRASFDRMATWIALNTEKPQNGSVQEVLRNTSYFDDIVTIKNDQEDIEQVRRDAVNLIYKMINDDMKALFTNGKSRPNVPRPCRHVASKARCEESLAGSLSAQLYARTLWPPVLSRPAVPDQTKSVTTMREEVQHVKSNHHELRDWNDKSRHPECGMELPLFVELEPQLQRFSVLSKRHFDEHFSKQGKLTGFVVVDYIEIASD